MKLSIKLSILGFFLPVLGILIGNRFIWANKKIEGRSIRRGSAISTILVFFAIFLILVYYIGNGF